MLGNKNLNGFIIYNGSLCEKFANCMICVFEVE
jgi:hypothetical protein